jgi:hypothetical protein
MIGFVFAEDSEANALYKKVTSRVNYANESPSKGLSLFHYISDCLVEPGEAEKAEAAVSKCKCTKKKKVSSRIDNSMVSGPQVDSFLHIGDVRYDSEKGFTGWGIDGSWKRMLDDCVNTHGIDPKIIEQNLDFIQQYIQEHAEGLSEMGFSSSKSSQISDCSPYSSNFGVGNSKSQSQFYLANRAYGGSRRNPPLVTNEGAELV